MLISFFAVAEEPISHLEIKTLISATYDKPNIKVETFPIAVVDDYALADWVQGQRGGRALLQRVKGKWTIMACGADGLKNLQTLTEAGIPAATANNIITELTAVEKTVDAHRLHLFSLFGTKHDPQQIEQHEQHNHHQH
ncbi:MAG: hypothetical protein RIS87_1407 [Pseudomonadota bacterium]|jgi:hypothetical protein